MLHWVAARPGPYCDSHVRYSIELLLQRGMAATKQAATALGGHDAVQYAEPQYGVPPGWKFHAWCLRLLDGRYCYGQHVQALNATVDILSLTVL